MQTDINGHTPPNPDVYRLNLMDTDINAHKQISRGAWSGKHTEQKVCEPHYKWDFGRVWGARWEPLETQGENGIDTGGGPVYTYRIRRA
jgi:hypothetical protein